MKVIQRKIFDSFDELSEWIPKNQNKIDIINIQIVDYDYNRTYHLFYWRNKPTITKK